MPHLVILYTPNLEGKTDMTALCRTLADIMIEQRDEDGQPVYPAGGTRVLAYPAAHFAVADGGAAGRAAGGTGDYAFVYLNLRMAAGRTDATKKRAGDAIMAGAIAHFDGCFKANHIGITFQIDEGQGEYNARHSNIHPLFQN
jgi:5-carboxymethyl-2-hydroxymuconate isomerase